MRAKREHMLLVQAKVDPADFQRMLALEKRRMWTESQLVRVAIKSYLARAEGQTENWPVEPGVNE